MENSGLIDKTKKFLQGHRRQNESEAFFPVIRYTMHRYRTVACKTDEE